MKYSNYVYIYIHTHTHTHRDIVEREIMNSGEFEVCRAENLLEVHCCISYLKEGQPCSIQAFSEDYPHFRRQLPLLRPLINLIPNKKHPLRKIQNNV